MRRLSIALVFLTGCFGLREAPPCVVDADCAYERICVQRVCTDPPSPCLDCEEEDPIETGCVDDSDCARGERCDLATFTCVDSNRTDLCTADADCGPPAKICVAQTCAPGCLDDPCDVGLVCNDQTGRCLPADACLDDRLEPNDASGEAAVVAALEGALRACPANADFYRLDLTAGDEANVQIDYAASEGRVGLALAGETVEVATSPGLASFTFVAPRDDTYAVRVILEEDFGGQPGAPYNLLTQVAWGACADDTNEPNDTPAQAISLAPGRHEDLAQCEANDDFFAVDAEPGDTLAVAIDFAHAEADLALELLDPNHVVVAESDTTTDDELLTYVVTSPGDHVVRVHLVQDGGRRAGAPYGLQISRTEPLRCAADAMEPNDTMPTAGPAALGQRYSVTACDGDDDWFVFTPPAGSPLTIDAEFTHAEGDIGLELFDAAGDLAASANSQTDDERIQITTSTGAYRLRVHLASDAGAVPGNAYALEITSSACAPDPFEPNESAAAAAPLPFGAHAALTMCEADADHYRFDLTAGQGVDIRLDFAHAEGDIDAELSTLSGTLLASGTSGDDDETILFSTQVGGTYVLRVYLYADAGTEPGNVYDLDLILR